MDGPQDEAAENSASLPEPIAVQAGHPVHGERPGWSRPLQSLLAATSVALILTVSAALIGLNYYRTRAAAIDDARVSMRVFSERLVERFNAHSDQTTMSIGMIASMPNAFILPAAERTEDKARMFREVLNRSPNLDGIYAAYPDGSFFHVVNLRTPGWIAALSAPADAVRAIRVVRTEGNRSVEAVTFEDADGEVISVRPPITTSYDPRTRPWYKAAAAVATPISVGPYQMATTGKLGMTLAQSHMAGRRIVIGADIMLDTIMDLLAEERITPQTVSFIVDTSGNPVIHSDSAIMRKLMTGHESEGDDPIVASIRSDDSWTDEPRFIASGTRTFLVLVTPLRSALLLARHRVVVAAPMDELTARARMSLIHALLISGLVVIAAILMALILARLITKSLHLLTASADRLQNLDFATPVRVNSYIREINLLTHSMNRARDAILTFALYVPKEFVRRGIQSGSFSGRTASRQEVTAMFTDIYDFTTISEAHSAEHVVTMLSEYFDIFEDAVSHHGGSIIQFLGDSVFAMWNAPVADEDHAVNACRCALAVETALAVFNKKQVLAGLPEFRTRIGIHTGAAVVGSVGATGRLQYTAMGDTINVASRLEGLNKNYGTLILASEAVVQKCSDRISFRALGDASAKGRHEIVAVFEVVGLRQ